MSTRVQSATWLSVAILAASFVPSVVAAGPSLEGRYGMTGIGACLSSAAGFYPNNVAVEPSSANSIVNRGVLTFHHDGTGSAKVFQTQLNLPPAAPFTFSGSSEITFNFTYRLGSEGTMTLDMLLDSYVATFLTGPRAGSSSTYVTTPPLSPTWVWSGTYSLDRKTLLLNNGDTLSKVRSSTGSEVYVICQLERVLTRLTP